MIISIFLDNKLLASFKSIVSRFILAGFLADNFFLESLYFLKIVFPKIRLFPPKQNKLPFRGKRT